MNMNTQDADEVNDADYGLAHEQLLGQSTVQFSMAFRDEYRMPTMTIEAPDDENVDPGTYSLPIDVIPKGDEPESGAASPVGASGPWQMREVIWHAGIHIQQRDLRPMPAPQRRRGRESRRDSHDFAHLYRSSTSLC